MARNNNDFGSKGEDAAAQWYEHAGYQLIERNWRCARGEIDLIVSRDATVVFVEVKARSSGRYGSGFDAVDWRKQRRLRQLARLWLGSRSESGGDGSPVFYPDVQFDVVDVDHRGNVQVCHQAF